MPFGLSMGSVRKDQRRYSAAYVIAPASPFPSFVLVTAAGLHEANGLDELILEAGAIDIMDGG